ncbi:Translation elongation factor 4 [Gracilaria domingensis]|nr:Translation elongation factor 4 [Gracilaria domingensis]
MSWGDHKVTLIDCPGHHDFSRQVSQSARAVEGALLKPALSFSLSSTRLIYEQLFADVDNARNQIENFVGIDASQAILTSTKQGIGIEELLDAVFERPPAPQGSLERPLQVRKGDRISPFSLRDSKELGNKPMEYIVETIGFLEPDKVPSDKLEPGDIGYLTASIKQVGDIPLGDTPYHNEYAARTHCGTAAAEAALPGYEPTRPVVFCGLFPSDSGDIHSLRVTLQKLQLQVGSIVFERDTSTVMGTGFRCGFLGLLHMSVTQERLETEFGLDLIASTPSVSYSIQPQGLEEWKLISNPFAIPSGHVKIMAPYAKVEIICSHDHIGPLMDLAHSRRGELRDQSFVGLDRVKLVYSVPLAELVTYFHDVLKSRSAGFASMNYEMEGMKPNKLKRMDIHVAGQPVDG